MTEGLLAVHAHPDDESITMGGTLARSAADGVPVTLVTATLGEEGEVIGPGLAELVAGRADQLGGYRYWELRAACRALGVGDQRFLGGLGAFRDSGMVGTAAADHPRAFVRARAGGPDHDRAVTLLAGLLDELRPRVVLTYDADGGYGHPDHVAAHEVTLAAARRAAVPRVLAVTRPRAAVQQALSALPVPPGYDRADLDELGYLTDGDAGLAVDVSGFRAARRSALAAHATQVDLIPGGFALSNRLAQPLLDREYFRVLAGPGVPPGADDLFAGL